MLSRYKQQSKQRIARYLIVCLFLIGTIRTYSDMQPASQHIYTYTISQEIQQHTDTIHAGHLFVTNEMVQQGPHSIRIALIKQLIAQGFSSFVALPYAGSGDNTITSISMGSGYEVLRDITTQDTLDRYISLAPWGSGTSDVFFIDEHIWSEWGPLYLFKDTQDLMDLGYEVVSHRTRTNKDEEYRRFNIFQSFRLIGNVKLLMPGETLDFMTDAQYDHYIRDNYLQGYAIIEGEEEKTYAGGICGASTALYQGILTNTGLEVTRLRNHSKRFSNLYNAYINHERIETPGIDSAVFNNLLDFTIKNISPHPVVLVMNYNGSYGGKEEVFTLSLPHTQGEFSFVRGGRSWKTEEIENPEGTGTITTTVNAGGCYTRIINGEQKRSCYNEVW